MSFRMPAGPSDYPRKNILTPLLWLNGITFPISAAAFMYSWQQGIVLLTISTIPLAVSLWYYRHWARTDPDRLQTEDYRIQKEYVARIVNYVDGKEIVLDPSKTRLTSSPVGGTDG